LPLLVLITTADPGCRVMKVPLDDESDRDREEEMVVVRMMMI